MAPAALMVTMACVPPRRLALTRQGLLRRNNAVYSAAFAAKTPLVIVFGGGYSRPIDASVAAHADVFRSAALRVAAL